MLELDGSLGEGGGQILRTSLALSLITGKPFHSKSIRVGRSKAGLQAQHLTSVRAAATIGQAHTDGASLHSTDLVFEPGAVSAGSYHFPIGTAGAISLVLHTIYLPLMLKGAEPSEIILEGGTHVNASPCFHFVDVTWRRYMELLGLQVSLRMRRPGFYPRGGGRVEAYLQPCSGIRGLQWIKRGPVRRITGFSAVAGLPIEIAERQTRQAIKRLRARHSEVQITQETWDDGPGTVLALVVEAGPVPAFFFGLGARGKRAERVADEAVDQALAYLDADTGAVDPHSGDQLILPLALAQEPSAFTVSEVTSHLQTNIAVVRQFVDRSISCEGASGGPGTVRIA